MTDDAQLLRQYVDTRSEVAFNQLVERHLGLVYHSVARQLGEDSHLAPDVTQGVFLLLAERARVLCNHPSLAGWLHTTAHFKVSAARRGERRRRIREEAAFAMRAVLTDSPAEAAWEQIRPILDDVVLELPKKDREAVLLRFFEGQAFAEIGLRLHLTEKGAYTRVDRALGRLRERLGRRGITSSATALATLLSAQASLATPAGMAATVAGAVAASPGPAASAAALIQIMSTAKTSVGILAAALVVASGVAIHEIQAYRQTVSLLAATEALNANLTTQLRAAQAESTRLAQAPPARAAGSAPSPVILTDEPDDGKAFLQAHPDVKKALLAQRRAETLQEYQALFNSLGLSPAQIERFVELELDGSMTSVGKFLLPVSDNGLLSEQAAKQRTSDLRALLGPAGYREYRNYEKMGAVRELTTQVAESVYFTPTPLTPGQASQFEQIIADTLSEPALASQGRRSSSLPTAAWESILAKAQGTLSAAQLTAVNDLYQEAAEMQAQGKAVSAYYEEARHRGTPSN
jgi:RNA polymerase sigma factor (sigma-70 family)